MFPVESNPNTGAAIDAEYVQARARWEPFYEVTQIKGDSEAHPYLSPEDEFAGVEPMAVVWDMPTAARPAANDSIQLQPPAKSV